MSTIALLMSIEARYPAMRLIHVFLDNARDHHATLVRAWLAQPGRRIKLPFHPALLSAPEPHRTPVGADAQERHPQPMLRHFQGILRRAMLGFLKEDVPRDWGVLCDSVSDNFRVISPNDFRVLT